MNSLYRITFPTLLFAWLISGCSSTGQTSSSAKSDSKWITLFNGGSTDALRGYKQEGFPSKAWVIENGALKTIVGGEKVDLITKEKFKNYELELEWKVSPAGNSGVIYNVAETDGPAWRTGPEMQVLDDSKHRDGGNPKTSAGALYALIAPNSSKTLKPVGEWNKAKLIIKNNHVEHWLNGAKVVEYEWGSPAIKALIAQSKFKDMPRFMQESEGHIALQHHGEEVWYRNIRIRRL